MGLRFRAGRSPFPRSITAATRRFSFSALSNSVKPRSPQIPWPSCRRWRSAKGISLAAFNPTGCSNSGGNTVCTPPATATCNGPFDPSGQSVCFNEIFDPLTNRTVGGSVVRSPFPNNTVPLTRFDPTAVIIQNMIPQPNSPGLINYTAPPYSNFRHTTIPSIKIDHSISSKMKLAGYYSATKTVSPQTNGFPQAFTALQPQSPLAQTIRLNLDTTLTPTLLFHVGAGYLHTSNPQGAPAYDQKQLFPNGVPFTASNYYSLHGRHVQSDLRRLERRRSLPGCCEYGRSVHAHAGSERLQADVQHQPHLGQGKSHI